MSTTLVLIVLGGLLAALLFIVSQWKRYRIRHTGILVMASVTQVQMWQDASRADYSLQSKMIPSFGDGDRTRFALNGLIRKLGKSLYS